jgi:SAM-dependent methyltransferase
MVKYSRAIIAKLTSQNREVNSFINKDDSINVDWLTVNSFSDEWDKFSDFSPEEISRIGNDYFDIALEKINQDYVVLEVGCGSGRWMDYLSDKVKFIEGIDPSLSVFTATKFLQKKNNTRVTHAKVDNMPFEDDAFDMVYSLGVLHHIPNTRLAMMNCVKKVKPGGYFLVYLYYNLDNRGVVYKTIFLLADFTRKVISKLPSAIKSFTCDVLAIIFYMPFVLISKLTYFIPFLRPFVKHIPLSYYRDKTFRIIRNDSLDRFGTPLEQRFSKNEIEKMMIECGLKNIKFSTKEPFWHAIGQK